jgi:hypothetical protein
MLERSAASLREGYGSKSSLGDEMSAKRPSVMIVSLEGPPDVQRWIAARALCEDTSVSECLHRAGMLIEATCRLALLE